MSALLGYVQTTSGGDPDKINLVANVKREACSLGLLEAPGNLRSNFGQHTGEIIFRWNDVKKHKMYTLQLSDTLGDDTKWTNAGFTGKLSYLSKELESSREYAFRVGTISTTGING